MTTPAPGAGKPLPAAPSIAATAEHVTVDVGSDFVVVVREFKVSEENLCADPETIRQGAIKTRLLEAITVAIESPGPYELRGGSVDWRKVIHGHREEVLRRARIFTWDAEYFRNDPCPACGNPTKNAFDLEAMPYKPLPESTIEHLRRSDAPLECRLPRSGRLVKFRLFRGQDEKELQRIYHFKKERRVSELLKARTVSIEGVEPPKLGEFLENLGGKDSSYYRWAVSEADCGVDQEGVWNCHTCSHRWVDDVSFDRGFFFPRLRGSSA